jgi:hypothetical protein
MSTLKDRRRNKYAGVLRDNRTTVARPMPTVEHSEPRQSAVSWRLVSGLVVLCLSALLALFFSADAFYVRSIAVGGIQYLTKEEIFAYADIANVHLFWVSPEQVRQNLLRSMSIADARVTLGWPPNMVNIIIEEREPALVWEQAGTAFWVDIRGRVMAQRQDKPELIRIAVQPTMETQGPLSESGRVDEAIVFGALELQDILPDVPVLFYDPNKGLGFRNSSGWDVWFGVGTGMPEKYLIYQAIAERLIARGIQAGEVNIVNPDAPFYTILWGRDPQAGQ